MTNLLPRAALRSSLLGVVLLGAPGGPGASDALGQNLLFNGNLDQTYAQVIVDNPDPTPDVILPKPLGWVNEGFRTLTGPYENEMSSEAFAGPTPTPVTTDASGLPSPDGVGAGQLDAGAFFKGFTGNVANGPATGHLYQDVPAAPGQLYQLTGWAGAGPAFLAAGAEISLEFLNAGDSIIGGQVIDLMPTLFVDNGQPFDYKQYTTSAVAPAGTVSARARVSMLGGTSNPQGGDQAFVADDFELTAVPEPASATLLAAGCAIALTTRRRRRFTAGRR